MTEPRVRLTEAEDAMRHPSLSLLRQKYAPVVLATLRPIFEQGQSSLPVDEFHARATRVFAVARDRDESFPVNPDDPRQVRDECRSWVTKEWLERHGEVDGEVYRISAEAREVIRIVSDLGRARSAMSESQIVAVITKARELALKVTADPQSRMDGIRLEIDDLKRKLADREKELADLEAGGLVELPDDEMVLDAFIDLREEIEGMPHDLKRVEDEFRALAQEVRDRFLSETRPHGEIVGEYLRRADELATADRYGRGFQSAKRLLTDARLQDQLRHDLETIVSYRFTVDPLNERDRADVRATMHMVTESVSAVLDQRDTLIARLVGFITRHNELRERELNDALKAAKYQLRRWAAVNTARATTPLPVGHHADHAGDPDGPVEVTGEMGIAETSTFREKPLKKRVRTDLTPLAQSGGGAPPEFSVGDLRAKGGPFYAELADAVERATRGGRAVPAAEVFNSLPEEYRRPVDIFGLVDLATRQRALRLSALLPGAPVEEFYAVRPDGTRKTFLLPALTFVSNYPTPTAPPSEDKTA